MADYLFRNMLRSRLSRSHFWQFFFFIFFLRWAESHSAGLKVFRCYSLFILLHSGSPRRFLLAPWEVADFFLFSCWIVWRLRRTWHLLYFLVFLFCPFLSSCPNLLLTVLTRLGGSKPFGGLWGSRLSFLQSSDMDFFSFSFFFSHKLLGFPFSFLMLLLGFKPLGLISSLFSWPPCAYFFELGTVNFLDLNKSIFRKGKYFPVVWLWFGKYVWNIFPVFGLDVNVFLVFIFWCLGCA